VLNHFENIHHLTTKSGLIVSLKNYYYFNQKASSGIYLEQCGYSQWDSTPLTFIVNCDFESADFKHFTKAYKQIKHKQFQKLQMPQKHCQANIWIVKPENLNQVAHLSKG